MLNSPINWTLRSVKVGDTVVVKDGYERGISKGKLAKVASVTLFKDGVYAGKARTVKLDDGTIWTGDGEKWGAGSSYKSAFRTRAYHVIDVEAFERQLQQEQEDRILKQRRALVEADVKIFTDYATDEEIRVLRDMQMEMKKRKAANIFIDFLRNLAGWPHNIELTP